MLLLILIISILANTGVNAAPAPGVPVKNPWQAHGPGGSNNNNGQRRGVVAGVLEDVARFVQRHASLSSPPGAVLQPLLLNGDKNVLAARGAADNFTVTTTVFVVAPTPSSPASAAAPATTSSSSSSVAEGVSTLFFSTVTVTPTPAAPVTPAPFSTSAGPSTVTVVVPASSAADAPPLVLTTVFVTAPVPLLPSSLLSSSSSSSSPSDIPPEITVTVTASVPAALEGETVTISGADVVTTAVLGGPLSSGVLADVSLVTVTSTSSWTSVIVVPTVFGHADRQADLAQRRWWIGVPVSDVPKVSATAEATTVAFEPVQDARKTIVIDKAKREARLVPFRVETAKLLDSATLVLAARQPQDRVENKDDLAKPALAARYPQDRVNMADDWMKVALAGRETVEVKDGATPGLAARHPQDRVENKDQLLKPALAARYPQYRVNMADDWMKVAVAGQETVEVKDGATPVLAARQPQDRVENKDDLVKPALAARYPQDRAENKDDLLKPALATREMLSLSEEEPSGHRHKNKHLDRPALAAREALEVEHRPKLVLGAKDAVAVVKDVEKNVLNNRRDAQPDESMRYARETTADAAD
ncbi:hypothetical protein B0T24DRAFT_687455 [Lasiosphaeria ovina]|uniref:Uncharacterized protein n=1 Tax=Lasiosphaeria ovina TaxID=92902 RepID=A0AAE0NKB2_9PEZI|nr:hypothetical protein B0T24DRAFT_687455 [Lasiosphaeria ovina]